jgi:hypothetical protein
MPVMAASKFEHFFRTAAGLDVDKSDLKRYSDFVGGKTHDLLVLAQANAKASNRDLVQPRDFPITLGMQRRIDEFKKLDEVFELTPIIDELAGRPPLRLTLSDEAEAFLPIFIGGLSMALARVFTVIDPKVKNPSSEHWERAFRVFDLVL